MRTTHRCARLHTPTRGRSAATPRPKICTYSRTSTDPRLRAPATSLCYPLIGNWVTRITAHPDKPRPCISSSQCRYPHPSQLAELQASELCAHLVWLDTPSTSRASGIRTYKPTGGLPHLRSPASSHHLRHPPATTPALNQKQPGVNQLPSSDWAECATCDGGLEFAEAQAAPDLSRSTLVRDSGQELRRQLRVL